MTSLALPPIEIEWSSQYRFKAVLARRRAVSTADGTARKVLLNDAVLWDRMADYEEQPSSDLASA
jgi:hypothetical protein